MSATATLTGLVTAAMKPHAAAGKYKKDKLTYRRRHGDTTQIVNFQLSHGNSASEARCYVNVAVAFDAIFALEGASSSPDKLKEYECPFRARLEDLVRGAPAAWNVNATTDTPALGTKLGACLGQAAAWLDAIDGPAAMLAREPLDRGAERFLRAQLCYVTGDLDGALAAARAGVAFFADRGMKLDKEIKRLRLKKLVGRE